MSLIREYAEITFPQSDVGSYLKILDVKVNRNSKVTSQPIESGEQRQDSKIREPITVTATCSLYDKNNVSGITSMLAPFLDDTKKTCTINTGVEVIQNMVLTDMPYEINGEENFDLMEFDLTFSELILVGTKMEQTKAPTKDNTSDLENSSTSRTSPKDTKDVGSGSAEAQNVFEQAKQSNESYQKPYIGSQAVGELTGQTWN